MPIEVPHLDTKTFEQLTSGLLREIPTLTDCWTDFNASDPGITLMEMLVWVAETLAYRLNRIPPNTYRNFLYLLGGASYAEIDRLLDDINRSSSPRAPYTDPSYRRFLEYLKQISIQVKPDRTQMREQAVRFYLEPYLAITQKDFEALCLQANQLLSEDAQVGRAIVTTREEVILVELVPHSEDEPFRYSQVKLDSRGTLLRHRHDSYLCLPHHIKNGPSSLRHMLKQVRRFLIPRTLLGCAVEVKLASFTEVLIQLELTLDERMQLSQRANELDLAIQTWLSPISGGADHKGWPYNQMPTSYQITAFLLKNFPWILYANCSDVSIVQRYNQNLDPEMIPKGQAAFLGFPIPRFKINLNKLTRRQ